MLESVDLNYKITKEEYKAEKDELVSRLALLQQKAHQANVPVIVVFEGWTLPAKAAASAI